MGFCLQAEKQDSLWLTLVTMVYSITLKEDTREINFLACIPIITDAGTPIHLTLLDETIPL